MDEYVDSDPVAILSCGRTNLGSHNFHQHCIDAWIAHSALTAGESKCPHCRAVITVTSSGTYAQLFPTQRPEQVNETQPTQEQQRVDEPAPGTDAGTDVDAVMTQQPQESAAPSAPTTPRPASSMNSWTQLSWPPPPVMALETPHITPDRRTEDFLTPPTSPPMTGSSFVIPTETELSYPEPTGPTEIPIPAEPELSLPYWRCPTEEHVYHSTTQLPDGRLSFIVDPGAWTNLMGKNLAHALASRAKEAKRAALR